MEKKHGNVMDISGKRANFRKTVIQYVVYILHKIEKKSIIAQRNHFPSRCLPAFHFLSKCSERKVS